MNTKKRFGLWRRHQYANWQKGQWERVKAFPDMDSAMHSLLDHTRKPKKERVYVYILYPITDRRRYILFRDDEAEQILSKAR